MNERMQDIVANSSKEVVMQSLGGELLWHVAAALPGLKGLKTLNDRAAESIACGAGTALTTDFPFVLRLILPAAGDNELFLVGRWFLVVGRGQALLKICTSAIAPPAAAAAAGPRMAEDAAVWLLHALTASPHEASLFAGSASLAARKEVIHAEYSTVFWFKKAYVYPRPCRRVWPPPPLATTSTRPLLLCAAPCVSRF